MKLLFLHGAPATGKLTVAEAVLRRVPGRLLDNHAAIDFARRLFDFGAPGFWELVHAVRLAALREAARRELPLIVTTFCYSHPADLAMFEDFAKLMTEVGGRLLPAHLVCSDAEIARRIGNPDRVARRKLSSAGALAAFRETYRDAAVPAADALSFDTGAASAEATADAIIASFAL